ncbi:MAG: hypothetical protein AAF468_05325 [Pseudomonadota bacterium]
MTFNEAAALLPQWVQIWMILLGVIPLAAVISFLLKKVTWKDAAWTVVLFIAGGLAVQYLYSQMGMVRLLGAGHLPFWIPLVVYLWRRAQSGLVPKLQTIMMWVLIATLVVAMAFDVYDVVRWLSGERAPIV